MFLVHRAEKGRQKLTKQLKKTEVVLFFILSYILMFYLDAAFLSAFAPVLFRVVPPPPPAPWLPSSRTSISWLLC